MTLPLEPFPQEVLMNISSWKSLSRPDLRNLRFVSKAWDGAAQCILFETVFLKISLPSIEKLTKISQNDRLRKHVRTLIYNSAKLCSRGSPEGFDGWLRAIAGEGLGLNHRRRKKFVSQRTPQQLEEHFTKYCNARDRQDRILSNEKKAVQGLLLRFPGLLCLQCIEEFPAIRKLKTLSFSSITCPITREILVAPAPRFRPSDRGRHFWALLQAASSTRGYTLLKDFRGYDLDIWSWHPAAAESLRDCSTILQALQHLTLEFHSGLEGDHTRQLAKMLDQTPSLKSLQITFDGFESSSIWYSRQHVVPLSSVFNDSTKWQHLTSLSLTSISASVWFLRDLLQKHAQTLRSLKLTKMHFGTAETPLKVTRDAWVNFFYFLNESLSLDHVRFERCFSGSKEESWQLSNQGHIFHGNHLICSEDCSEFPVERFVTHRGPSPFPQKPDAGQSITGTYLGTENQDGSPYVENDLYQGL